MKKLFTISLILLLGLSTNFAQDYAKKGVIEAGGNAYFTMTTAVMAGETAENSQNTFGIEPYIGYFISNGFELGIIPSFINSSFDEQSQTTLGIFLALRMFSTLKARYFHSSRVV